ncbi:hypothetical protein D3C84_988150 [compost metagenome]
MAVGLARLHRAGDGNRLAHQQEFLGDGGLTGVGVGNDGECAPFGDFGGLLAHAGGTRRLIVGLSKKGAIIAVNGPQRGDL